MTPQEEGVANMRLGLEVVDSLIYEFLMGIFGHGTHINANPIEIIAGTCTQLYGRLIAVVLALEVDNTQSHEVINE